MWAERERNMGLYEDYTGYEFDFSRYASAGGNAGVELTGNTFETFKNANPDYLKLLDRYIEIIYGIYNNLYFCRVSRILKDEEMTETANRLGFGTLMRHAMEMIVKDLAIRCGIDPKGKTANELLTQLEESGYLNHSLAELRTLSNVRRRTNEIAHPHILRKHYTYEELTQFYQSEFRDVIMIYINGCRERTVRKYLVAMLKRLDNFRLKDRITRFLILGNLTRQLTECAINRWSYRYKILPTDASTKDVYVDLDQLLEHLRKKEGSDSGLLKAHGVTTLQTLKNKSNALMHVDAFGASLRGIREHGKAIRELRPGVRSECSPAALTMKLDWDVRRNTALKTTLLCGFLGWFGAHQFYAGNIRQGILFLLTLGWFLVGPIVSMFNIITGNFHTNRWGYLGRHWLVTVLCLIFIALHAAFIYAVFFG